MDAFITALHILACLALIAIVLLQHGKGADIGAAFGAGASNTVFGARGAGNFLTKLTTGAVVVFMGTSITLSYFSAPRTVTDIVGDRPVLEAPTDAAEEGAPALPGSAPIEEIPSPGAGAIEEIPPPNADAIEEIPPAETSGELEP